MSKKKINPIDKVTTTNLSAACRVVGINLPIDLLDNIIDLIELIEKKGDKTTLMDLCKLKATWNG